MNLDDLEIELNNEDVTLIEEIQKLHSERDEIESKRMNNKLLDSIKTSAIESITTSLGISDILENRAHNTALDFEKEYKRHQDWESKPTNERTKSYKTKFVPESEFSTMMDNAKNINYQRKPHTGKTFTEAQKKLRKDNPENIDSVYTGKTMEHGGKYDYEHIISVNEVVMDPVLNQFFSTEEKKAFLHSSENFGALERDINSSKNNVKVKDLQKWLSAPSKKNSAKSNEEYFEINKDKFNQAIEKVSKKKEELLQSKSIKYDLKTTGKIAAKNAAKGATKAVIGKLLSITVVEVVTEFQVEEKSELTEKIKNISKRITAKSKDLLNTFKDHSINTFISTILDAILNSLFKIAKNIYKFLKASFRSVLEAIKILFSSQFTWEVRLKEALKILAATVGVLIGIALDEMFEKALISAFPPSASFAGYVSPILAGLVVGIGSVLLIQAWDTYKDKFILKTDDKLFKLDSKEMHVNHLLTNNNLVRANIASHKAQESTFLTKKMFSDSIPVFASLKSQLEESRTRIDQIKTEVENKANKIAESLDETDNLLNKLNLI